GLKEDDRLLWAGLGALLLGAYHPAGYVMRVGQITFVIACLILWSLELAGRGRDRAAGIALAVGLVLKPVCAPLLLYYLLKRRWSVVGWTALALVVALGVGLLMMGGGVHQAYMAQFLSFTGTAKFAPGYQNIPAFLMRLLAWPGHSPISGFEHLVGPLSVVGTVLLLLPAIITVALRPWEGLTRDQRLAELSLLLLAAVLTVAASGLHAMVYALPGLVAVAAWLRSAKPGSRGWLAAWAAAYCLIALPFQYRAPGLEHGLRVVLISSKLAGGLILWGMLLRICVPARAEVTE
ncbi:MAG: DUF2029 domain-containing protein, partial [Armatimonadetes bacterium]|nr:DUF2029 domain-containing protein [Armatimonadota bacterium]